MRKKIVAGNWKMNTTVAEGVELAKGIVAKINEVPSNVQLITATPFTHLVPVYDIIKDSGIALSAQNCSNESKGAFTGEISAAMLKSAGCQYTILGHSECREYMDETSRILVQKMNRAFEYGLKVIFCCGEKLDDRKSGRYADVVISQIEKVVFKFPEEMMANIIIAYEPIWAIGTGITATAEQAQEIHALIRAAVAEEYNKHVAENMSILYGGSCKPSNAKQLFACPDIDGGLIGGASLKADDFVAIAKCF